MPKKYKSSELVGADASEGEDDAFVDEEDSADDEATMEAEERSLGTNLKAAERAELEDLQAENELSIEELMARYGYGAPSSGSELGSDDESLSGDSDESSGLEESGSEKGSESGSHTVESSEELEEQSIPVAQKRRKVEAKSPSPVRTRGTSRSRGPQVAPVKTEVTTSPRITAIPSGWLQPDSEPSEGYASPVRSPPAPSPPKPNPKPSPATNKGAKNEVNTAAPETALLSPPKVAFTTMSPRMKSLPTPQVAGLTPNLTAAVPAIPPSQDVPIVKLVADRPFLQKLEARKSELEGKLAEINEAAAAQAQPEPEKPKCHWEFLLAEMRWLAQDFMDERKWKRNKQKTLGTSVIAYVESRESKAVKDARALELARRRRATKISKHVTQFWTKIDKLVVYKHRSQLEAKRREALDRHLSFLVAQTEKYSSTIVTPEQAVGAIGDQDVWKTPVPFLMSQTHPLREYQRAGIDWLVSMHDRRLNGILADEMGLGKTIQTIALLSHLAATRCIWGPHLIVVPTSTMLNWDTEFKRWAPGFKVVTYYGSVKERKQKRMGWTKPNAFHVCITSYQLVVHDASIFRRKKWHYMILDEAHYIKNFKSQRWQTLLTFPTRRRLLLTGTPLQNSLMELWALLHFLMPHLFRSQAEFKEWFSTPLTAHVEGVTAVDIALVKRLHSVLRPFILRRLKADVAKQLPKKYEHVVTCRLSNRQRYLYEEFMSRSSTRASLASGNYMSMMNVLMQLRKVCNHPDLFEPRPIASPFQLNCLHYTVPSLVVIHPCVVSPLHGLFPVAVSDVLGVGPLADSVASRRHFQFHSDYLKRSAATFAEMTSTDALRYGMACDDADNVQPKWLRDQIRGYSTFAPGHLQLKDLARSLAHFHALLRQHREAWRKSRQNLCAVVSQARCVQPVYLGVDTIAMVSLPKRGAVAVLDQSVSTSVDDYFAFTTPVLRAVLSPGQRLCAMSDVVAKYVCAVPKAQTSPIRLSAQHVCGLVPQRDVNDAESLAMQARQTLAELHPVTSRLQLSFPDKWLVQYDCGKFQVLAQLLRERKRGGHRCLVFTQMTKMLDILETFMNLNGHTYMRLDGSTKVEDRQRMMERFNRDAKVFAFILSTRSGGLGINLVGADTVIFYDSDWNPAMDAQAQDRAHRIGQTRDVHIFRLISEYTVEENIFLKAKQKRQLNDLSLEQGKFSMPVLQGADLKDIIGEEYMVGVEGPAVSEPVDITQAMAAVEDESDLQAGRRAQLEADAELAEFSEVAPLPSPDKEKEEGEGDHDDTAAASAPSEPAPELSQPPLPKSKSRKRVKIAHRRDDDDISSEEEEGEQGPDDTDELIKKLDEQHDDVRGPAVSDQPAASASEPPEKLTDRVQSAVKRMQALESQLTAAERRCILFREDTDPHPWVLPEVLASVEATFELEDKEWEVAQLDAIREEEEARFDADQELLNLKAVNGTENVEGGVVGGVPAAATLYRDALRSLMHQSRLRAVTGKDWEVRMDQKSGCEFYFNTDSGQATWEKPLSVHKSEARDTAKEGGFSSLAVLSSVVLTILRFCHPLEDRPRFAGVCSLWRKATCHPALKRLVLASQCMDAESCAPLAEYAGTLWPHRVFPSLPQALDLCLPGEVVVVARGSHFCPRPVVVTRPVLVLAEGDRRAHGAGQKDAEDDAWVLGSDGMWIVVQDEFTTALKKQGKVVAPRAPISARNVVIEATEDDDGVGGSVDCPVIRMSSAMVWQSRGGRVEGLSLRNVNSHVPYAVHVLPGCSATFRNCHLSNYSGTGSCVAVDTNGYVVLTSCRLVPGSGSCVFVGSGNAILNRCVLRSQCAAGVSVLCGCAAMRQCMIEDVSTVGVRLFDADSILIAKQNKFQKAGVPAWDLPLGAPRGAIQRDDNVVTTASGQCSVEKDISVPDVAPFSPVTMSGTVLKVPQVRKTLAWYRRPGPIVPPKTAPSPAVAARPVIPRPSVVTQPRPLPFKRDNTPPMVAGYGMVHPRPVMQSIQPPPGVPMDVYMQYVMAANGRYFPVPTAAQQPRPLMAAPQLVSQLQPPVLAPRPQPHAIGTQAGHPVPRMPAPVVAPPPRPVLVAPKRPSIVWPAQPAITRILATNGNTTGEGPADPSHEPDQD